MNIASRMESQGLPGQIQVSSAVATRLAGRYQLTPRGSLEIKGKGLMTPYLLSRRIH